MIKLVNYWLFSVPVEFEVSWGKILFSRHLIVKLSSQNRVGIGEGVLYKTDGLSCQKFITKISKIIQNEYSISTLQNKLQKFIPQAPGVVCAFDMALWDLKSKIDQNPLNRILGTPLRKKIEITEQIFITNNHSRYLQLKEIIKNQNNLKIKIGKDIAEDLEFLKRIRKKYLQLNIQVDANQALDPNKLKMVGEVFQNLRIKAIEEPSKKTHWSQFNQLKTPIILDESILSLSDLKNAIGKKAVNILNIKLSRLGGITNALKFIKFCQQKNIKITLGCSEEFGIGTAAILHLSSIVKNLYSTEGFGPQRLGFDIIDEKFNLEKGKITVPKKNGLGNTFNVLLLKKNSRAKKFQVLEKKSKNLKFNLDEFKNILKSKIINFFILLKTRLISLK